MKAIRTYRALPFERRMLVNTVIGLCFSSALALGKFAIGLFTDYNLVSIAVYTFAILLAKLQCVLGIKSEKRAFRQRNAMIARFLLAASLIYIGFMSRMFFIERKIKNNTMSYVLILAFLSFCELGFAIAGLIRTKSKGHYYRNIRIINFCVALIAILTTQMAILNMETQTGVVDIGNAYTGIGVGVFIALCAVYIFVAPKTSVVGREHQTFVLRDGTRNRLIDMEKESAALTLCRSRIYGDYVFRASVEKDTVEGDIGRTPSLWKRMHVVWKVLCCILSEILIFVWFIGRGVLFFRSIDLPSRLNNIMEENGFVRKE